MLYWVIRKNSDVTDGQSADLYIYLTESQLIHAVLRNFGGSDEFHPLEEFHDCLQSDVLEEVICLYLKVEMLPMWSCTANDSNTQ